MQEFGISFTIALTLGEQFEAATGYPPHGCDPTPARNFADTLQAAGRMMQENMNRTFYGGTAEIG